MNCNPDRYPNRTTEAAGHLTADHLTTDQSRRPPHRRPRHRARRASSRLLPLRRARSRGSKPHRQLPAHRHRLERAPLRHAAHPHPYATATALATPHGLGIGLSHTGRRRSSHQCQPPVLHPNHASARGIGIRPTKPCSAKRRSSTSCADGSCTRTRRAC